MPITQANNHFKTQTFFSCFLLVILFSISACSSKTIGPEMQETPEEPATENTITEEPASETPAEESMPPTQQTDNNNTQDDPPVDNTPPADTTPPTRTFIAETLIQSWDFETQQQIDEWDFSTNNYVQSASTDNPYAGNYALKADSRNAHYFGPGININHLNFEQLYVVRARVRKLGQDNAQINLNLKINDSNPTYIELTPLIAINNEWHLMRAFVYLTEAQANQSIHLYFNTGQSYDAALEIDEVTISTINTAPETSVPISEKLVINNNQLTMENSNHRLQSINLIAYLDDTDTALNIEHYWKETYAQFTQADFTKIKNMNFNAVRLALDARWFEDKNANLIEKGFLWLDLVIAWVEEAGIKVILDMHAPQGGGFQGPGSNNAFWTQNSYQTRFIDLWKAFATRYKDHPTIAAFDLINEPTPPQQADYISLLDQVIPEVLTIDPNRLLIVENTFAPDAQLIVRAENNVIHDSHFYDPWNSFTNDNNAKWGENGLDQSIISSNFSDLINTYQNKVFHIGEFGQHKTTFEQKNSLQWIQEVKTLLDDNGFHYSYFSYKGNVFGLYGSEQRFSDQSSKNTTLIDWFTNNQ